ncbi:TonB-dependent receptor [Pontibacter sp. G13]|uniref:TonB-dependent receptor n=1 Tax=Pontibacter sp. G13 TaxID=3074898 RepID=UPI0028890C86|nr:TonB-dependent receptor [Pontibacter sp. G13]WNJ17169.1 TonB-dependent receptor [Pontibacter sp. G13]
MRFALLLGTILCFFPKSWAQLPKTGAILGEIHSGSGAPLANAEVWLLPDSQFQISDPQGHFEFEALAPGSHTLLTRLVGFQTQKLDLSIKPGQTAELSVEMIQTSELPSVDIFEEHAKQEQVLTTIHLDAEDLAMNIQGSFSKALAALPGMDAINTGVGVAKPVIRGLSFNRIIVNDLGIKQEGQQWGADHGLEIDPFSVARVEIIKGPASLQYGSDGLGGVINLLPPSVPETNSVTGDLTLLGKSNNAHIGGSALVVANVNDVWISARYTHQDFGDYRVNADSFVYQTYVLPIFDGYLKNTAGNETNLQVQAGIKRDWGLTRITYSQYNQETGIFPGAVGVPRSYTLQPDGDRRNIDLPSQSVRHDKVIVNQFLMMGDHHISIDLGYQRNFRQEYAFPEFHNQPEIDLTNTEALNLSLQTWTANGHLQLEPSNHWTHILGFNTQYQTNVSGGWEFLLPNFTTFRAGGYFITSFKPSRSRWEWNGGIRYDVGQNTSEAFSRFIWDSNGRIMDSLSVPETNTWFQNVSGSIGGTWNILPAKSWLRMNLGKTFRVPYPSETVSNGVHHGSFRHEQGDPNLTSEHGYQLDLGWDWQGERFEAHVSTFLNFFDNFIYLAPSGEFSTLPEAGQIYRYQQNDALYSGFEIDWEWNVWRGLSIHQTADYVWNMNLDTYLSLPFTPQPAIQHELAYQWEMPESRISRFRTAISYRYVFANGPNRVDRNELTTPSYQLVDASVATTLKWQKFQMDISLQAQNLLNAAYLNHLSRYRLINVPEQGRNFVLMVKVPIEGRW